MPVSPALPCRHATCREFRPCPVHEVEHARALRERRPDHDAWYHLQRWRHPRHGLRAQALARSPLCVECRKAGIVCAATEVDHVVPHRGDPLLFWSLDNLQGLCHTHHGEKTGRGL